MRKFMFGNQAVSPVIGTILMVAITVIMAAIIGGFVYQTGRPKISPNLATTLEDDSRYILDSDNDGRIAKLTVEGGQNIAKGELNAIAVYTGEDDTEYTVVLDGADWNAFDETGAASAVTMGTGNQIMLLWVDSDQSGDVTPGDRLDFYENVLGDGVEGSVLKQTDFEVKVVHKSTEATLASHAIKVN